jgi:hypothetical protein
MATNWWDQNNLDSYGISDAPSNRQFNITLVNLGNWASEAGAATLNLNYNSYFTALKSGVGGSWTVVGPGESGTHNYGTWVYPLDQSPYMVDSPVSRIPPYIAVGYAQFVGYL